MLAQAASLLILIRSIQSITYDRNLNDIYQGLFDYKEALDQSELLDALDLLNKQYIDNQTYEEENEEVQNIFFNQSDVHVLRPEDQDIVWEPAEGVEAGGGGGEAADQGAGEAGVRQESQSKMSEQDRHQLEKIRLKIEPVLQEYRKKISELEQIREELNNVLAKGLEVDFYRMLEFIESKIVLGLFRHQNLQYREVDIFMQKVDHFFQHQNFLEDERQIKIILSMFLNVINNLKTKLHDFVHQFEMEDYEQMLFYSQSQDTHNNAKAYYENILNELKHDYEAKWQNFINNEVAIINETQTLKSDILQWQNISMKTIKRTLNQNKMSQINLNHVWNDFFHSNDNNQHKRVM